MGGVLMKKKELPYFMGYSGMGEGRVDYDAFHGITPRMVHWGSHCHDFYEFYIHFSGGYQMAYGNQFYDMEPYQLFIFPPFSMHSLVCPQGVINYERAFLYCSLDGLRRASCGQIDLDYVFRAALADKGNMFYMNKEEAEEARSCLRRIMEKQDDKQPEVQFENYGLIMSFLNLVLRAVRRKDASVPGFNAPNAIQQIIGYINEHYREPLRLKDISDHFNISQSALSHDFVRYTNRGVYDYILFRRVTLARQLILSGEPFGEISEQCGFSDYSNFLRIFHKHMGMSPREYRIANQKNSSWQTNSQEQQE